MNICNETESHFWLNWKRKSWNSWQELTHIVLFYCKRILYFFGNSFSPSTTIFWLSKLMVHISLVKVCYLKAWKISTIGLIHWMCLHSYMHRSWAVWEVLKRRINELASYLLLNIISYHPSTYTYNTMDSFQYHFSLPLFHSIALLNGIRLPSGFFGNWCGKIRWHFVYIWRLGCRHWRGWWGRRWGCWD